MTLRTSPSLKAGPCPLHCARFFNPSLTRVISTSPRLKRSWPWIRSQVARVSRSFSPVTGQTVVRWSALGSPFATRLEDEEKSMGLNFIGPVVVCSESGWLPLLCGWLLVFEFPNVREVARRISFSVANLANSCFKRSLSARSAVDSFSRLLTFSSKSRTWRSFRSRKARCLPSHLKLAASHTTELIVEKNHIRCAILSLPFIRILTQHILFLTTASTWNRFIQGIIMLRWLGKRVRGRMWRWLHEGSRVGIQPKRWWIKRKVLVGIIIVVVIAGVILSSPG